MKTQDEAKHRDKILLLLREIRQEKGIRQVDMAEQLGVPQSFVSKYESGTRRLDIIELRHICQVLGISLQDFIQKMEEMLNEAE
jgi:transcriptional regulator with XRE-family HTH domain